MKKIIFIDLDGTLIDTISNETFPKGIWDMKFKLAVWKSLKKFVEENKTEFIGIISNQGGISKGFVNELHFNHKLKYICDSLSEYLDIPVYAEYCSELDQNNWYRKPNPGMIEEILDRRKLYENIGNYDKSEMIMIGDASGKDGQFSDSDLKTAQNFKIEYIDVIDLIKQYNKHDIKVITKDKLLDKAINWFRLIADGMQHITPGNVSHQAVTIRCSATDAAEYIEKHKNDENKQKDYLMID